MEVHFFTWDTLPKTITCTSDNNIFLTDEPIQWLIATAALTLYFLFLFQRLLCTVQSARPSQNRAPELGSMADYRWHYCWNHFWKLTGNLPVPQWRRPLTAYWRSSILLIHKLIMSSCHGVSSVSCQWPPHVLIPTACFIQQQDYTSHSMWNIS